MNKAVIKKIIEQNALLIKTEKNDFFFTSNDSNWAFDFRKIFMQWKFLQELSSFFWDKYENQYPFQVWWLELGAIPFITGIVMEWQRRWKNINSFFVRKERKKTGLWNQIEGQLWEEKIIIVDDLFNSGKSITRVYNSLWEKASNIFKVFTFVNFWNQRWREFLEEYKLLLDYEFTLSDFWLDVFGHTLQIERERYKNPIIFPHYQIIYSWKNSNQFLEVPKSSPIKQEKNIYIWWEWGDLISLCSDTGNINWKFSVDTVLGHKNILSSPIIIQNQLIFWAYDGNLYSLDIKTWEEKWKMIYSDWIGSSPIYSKKYNQIYIGLELGGLHNKWSLAGVDFQSWEKKWEVFFDDYVHCSPWYSETLWLVLCWGNDGKLICVKGDTGKIIFQRKFHSPIKWGFAFSKDWKIVYFWCFDNTLYALSLLTWEIVWDYKTNNAIYAKPVMLKSNIFIGSLDKYMYHLDSNWKLINKIKTFWKIFSEITYIENNIIAFGSNDSYIYFYDFIQQRVLFTIEHKERISTKLIYDSKYKHLYVYDFLNILYKYDVRSFLR